MKRRLFTTYAFRFFFGVIIVYLQSPVAAADEFNTLSSDVMALRQLAESARQGKISAEQIVTLKKLRRFVSQDPHVIGPPQTNRSSAGAAPILIFDRAQNEDAVPIDCREVQSRFYQAKAQWAQLLCVVDRILQLSAAPCPDLHCIRQLRSEAELIKTRIDDLYPPEWDQKDLKFTRSWVFDPLRLKAQLDAFLGNSHNDTTYKHLNLQFTGFRSVMWHDAFWADIVNVPYTHINIADNRVEVVQDLSVTNYCLESIRLNLELNAKISDDERPLGVHIQF